MRRRALPLLLALNAAAQTPAPAPSPAPAPTQQLDKVTVTSGPTASSRRKNSTASKIVIDREDLARYGDTQLGDVLRRLPGVTLGGRPGRGGDIRLRGMGGGFTQILIDGERAPAGFSVEQLPPEQVERIEILRAPTAETGARAVAGTINIILREPLAKATNELRVGLGGDHGEPQADFAWTRNGKWFDEVLVGALSLNGNLLRRWNDIDTTYKSFRLGTGDAPPTPTGESGQLGAGLSRNASLNANARLRWKLSDTQQLWISPVAFLSANQGDSRIAVRGNSRYDAATGASEGGSALVRLNLSWLYRPNPTNRWELRGGIGRTRFDNDSQREETRQGARVRTQVDASDTVDDNRTLGGKWSLQTDREHQWVSGWEWEAGERLQTRSTLENGAPKPGLEEFGDSLAARTQRVAAYTQNEWNPSPQWSVYAGLRWEQMRTQGDAGGVLPPSETVSRVASPLFHLLWKPSFWPKDQIRASLTRSYRAPGLNDLIARPVVNSSYPNGANPQTHPDSAGNPLLQPELASGLDLSWEHWLASGGILMVSGYVREVDGLIRRVLVQENVPWDAQPRWVSRPRNLDKARTMGIELEAKSRLDELWDAAPDALAGLLLRANLAVFASKVKGVPGPDNRLDQQPRGTLNLGADYLLPDGWLKGMRTGFNWGYVPVTRVQQTPLLLRRDNARRVLDAYLQWASGDPRDGITWRLSLANLAPADTVAFTQVDVGTSRSTTQDRKRSFAVWNLRAEMRL